MGYNACFVAKCALEGGGNPEQIINGAIEAGVKSNVIAECAIIVRGKNDKIAKLYSKTFYRSFRVTFGAFR